HYFFAPILGVFILLFSLLGFGRREGEREAMFYKKLEGNKVVCELCPRYCLIEPNKRGFCRNRENRNGRLYSIVYAYPCSVNREPIEKAPFFHFLPGELRLTLATVSCNQRCKYCQNWEISQRSLEEVPSFYLPPEEVVKTAKKWGVKIICFTYTEPIVFYEYMYDIAKLARKEGIKSVLVTGGYINEIPLRELCKVVDGIKVDLKGFNEDFYEKTCSSTLQPVLDALKIIREEGVWLEIVNLVVPSLNDDLKEIKKMCQWIRENLGEDVPLHFTRFFPNYKLQQLPPTPIKTLEAAHQVARECGLKYVYLGNCPGHKFENTYCPKCGTLLIKRVGITMTENHLKDGKCPKCGEKIPGIFTLIQKNMTSAARRKNEE
ncbi:MAG: AmmeMemoRadiSam system radical SAM enzyme, partial [candidate division WOR-3 bacterium]